MAKWKSSEDNVETHKNSGDGDLDGSTLEKV